jgi:hypothetical protein
MKKKLYEDLIKRMDQAAAEGRDGRRLGMLTPCWRTGCGRCFARAAGKVRKKALESQFE